MSQHKKPHVLFLCTGNSCRREMAESWARHVLGDRIESYSAGIAAHGMKAVVFAQTHDSFDEA